MLLYIYDWSYETSDHRMLIRVYGLNERNETVVLHIDDFRPHVYMELPTTIHWTVPKLEVLCDAVDKKCFRDNKPVERHLVKRKRLYYAHTTQNMEDQLYPYVQYRFLTNTGFRNFPYRFHKPLEVHGIGKVQLKLHETSATPILQLACTQNIPMSGWVDYGDGAEAIVGDAKETSATHEYRVRCTQLHRNETAATTPAPTVLSFDLEVFSSNPNRMPDAQHPHDVIFQISCIFWVSGDTSSTTQYLLSLGTPDPKVVGLETTTLTFPTEAALIVGFAELIHRHNPHIITGWNILGFDFPYLLDRAKMTMTSSVLSTTGMVVGKQCQELEDTWSSAAYGNQSFRYLDMDGRILIDLLAFARRELKFPNYKLETIASHYLNAHKDPFTAKDIFASYERGMKGDHQYLGECGHYCVQDGVLVQRLFEVFDTWIGLTEMSNVCNVPSSYLYTKGQQIKVFSQVTKYCHDHKIVVENDAYKSQGNEKYQGATVLQPVPGLYKHVIPFDFASLYPTIIIAYNIDYSTFVVDESIPDEWCHVIEWSEHVLCTHTPVVNEQADTYLCENYRYRFLKHPKGVLPSICEHMLVARKKTRTTIKELTATMNTTENPEERALLGLRISILHKRQLAYKINVNSMYGSMGVKRGYLPFMPGAMAVTAMGRYNLRKAATHLETAYKATLVYGDTDSCYVRFPHIENPIDLWSYAEQIETDMAAQQVFPSPMKLEFENAIYDPFLILTKKRYMWRDFHRDGTSSDTVGNKGVILSRRDNSNFAQTIYKEVVNGVFEHWTQEQTMQYIVDRFNQCCSTGLPHSDFIITKKVGAVDTYKIRPLATDGKKRKKRLQDLRCTEDEYESRALPAQVQLAERMRSRGIRIDAGQRIEYVVTTRGGPKAKLFDKIEDPEYRSQHASVLAIDYLYYIKLISTQLSEIMKVVFDECTFTASQLKLRQWKLKLHEELKSYFRPVLVVDSSQ